MILTDQTKITLKKWLKNIHRHRKKKPDIFLFTLPRSGSTLLTEIINVNPKIKTASEPFALNKSNEEVLQRFFSDSLSERYIDITNNHLNDIYRYFTSLSHGKTWNAYYWSDFFSADHSFHTNRTFFKLQKLTYYYTEILSHFKDAHGIYLLRHPVAVSLSRMRNNWDDYIDQYSSSKKIKSRLTEKQIRLITFVQDKDDLLLKFVVSWCLENYLFISDYNSASVFDRIIPILYEDLIASPEIVIKKIVNHLGISFEKKMVDKTKRPSKGIIHSSDLTKAEIFKNNKSYLAERWKGEISQSQREDIDKVLRIFNVSFYLDIPSARRMKRLETKTLD